MPIGTRFHSNSPDGVTKAVCACDSFASGIWWYPLVRSNFPKCVGFASPMRVNRSRILGSGQPVFARLLFRRRKSIQYLQGSLEPAGFFCRWTWDQAVAFEVDSTLRSTRSRVIFSMASSLARLCLRGDSRLDDCCHSSSLTRKCKGVTRAGRKGNFEENTSRRLCAMRRSFAIS